MSAGAFALTRMPDGSLRAPAFIDLSACARFPAAPDVEVPPELARSARAAGYGLVVVAPLAEQHAQVPGTLDGHLAFTRHLADPLFAPACSPVRGHDIAEIASLARAPERPRAFRLTHPVSDSALLRRVFEMARAHGLLVIVPSLDGALAAGAVAMEGPVATRLGLAAVPEAAEAIEIARLGELARLTGARVHVAGVCSALGVRALGRARSDGAELSGSTTAVHLAVDERALLAHPYDERLRMWPPLPTQASREALVQAVRDGALCVSSGHAPAPQRERSLEFALVTPGSAVLADTPGVVFALLDDDKAVRALATEPARILGLAAPPGALRIDPAARGAVTGGPLDAVATRGAFVRENGAAT